MKHVHLVILVLLLAITLIGCTVGDSDKAQTALTDYFYYLNQGEFGQAAKLYGGDYDLLADWNPGIDSADHAKLFELGCLVNGLQCLPIMEVGAVEHSAEGVYEFYVQFENQDGSRFVLDEANAATNPTGTESTFKYTVFLSGDSFLVRELPPYLP